MELTRAEKVARNILVNHGAVKLARLIRGLEAQESGQAIASDLGVSRERVRQWKHVLTRSVTVVTVDESVARLLAHVSSGGHEGVANG
jgi:ABC-type enterobactin transport system permease subunit